MIRTVVTPQEQNISINIPKELVGKEIEILVYSTDEIHEAKPSGNLKKLRGKLHLTEKQYNNFQNYVQQSRDEWS